MSKLQLQNDKVVLTYDEDTKTLVSIKFIDKNAETIFNWPHKCKHINASCFHNSRLEEIHGIEDVEDIRYGAFSQCHNLKSFNWPQKSKTVSSWCFSNCERLYEINGLETINSIECNAFRGCGLQKIDLSGSACFHIDKTAFAETDINEVISGYFAEIPQNR